MNFLTHVERYTKTERLKATRTDVDHHIEKDYSKFVIKTSKPII